MMDKTLDIKTRKEFVDALRMVMLIEKSVTKHGTKGDSDAMNVLFEEYWDREFKKYIDLQFGDGTYLMYIGKENVGKLLIEIENSFSLEGVPCSPITEIETPQILENQSDALKDVILGVFPEKILMNNAFEKGIYHEELIDTLGMLLLMEKMSYKKDEDEIQAKLIHIISKYDYDSRFYSYLPMVNSLRLNEVYAGSADFAKYVIECGKNAVREAGYSDNMYESFISIAHKYYDNLEVDTFEDDK